MNERQAQERESIRGTTGEAERMSAEDAREDDSFLPADRMQRLRDRWAEIQTRFVDDPKIAVQQAHQLVTELVTELTDIFTRERKTLDGQWNTKGEADTETLRVSLQRYRTLFNRLLST